eukprot:TRINITY_DN72807_c0_g1_i1.p2 TRINITY_DN72807_c0_g1~~TRINITY_DN72807_c0_g1_i1.p2  ORF type:complete len:220 (+),score=80.63 TRINITY_DN72807_c0_g1_i1:51-710(+)
MGDQGVFTVAARNSSGAAAAKVVHEALASPNLFVFGELFELPSVVKLAEDPATRPTYDLLAIFTYGTYDDYRAQREKLPELTPAQLKKLKQLTLVTLASKARHIPYGVLQEALEIPDVRVLEDAIIDAITSNLLSAKLDQASRCIEVIDVIGRDIQLSDLDGMIDTLGAWVDRSTASIQELDRMIAKAKVMEDRRQPSDNEINATMQAQLKAVRSELMS